MNTEFIFLTEGLALFLLYATIGISLFVVAMLGTYTKFKLSAPFMAVFFAIFMGVSYLSLGELLGRPKPVDTMTWDRPNVEKATVMGQFHVKGKGIYLILMYKVLTVPRYYQFPWNEKMSKKLKRGEAAQKMKEIQGLQLKLPFQHSWEDRNFPEVYEIPWPTPPAKDAPQIDQLNLNTIDS